MAGLSAVTLFMLQIPGLEAPDLTFGEQMAQLWRDGGFMMWPLSAFGLIGLIVIVWKLIHLTSKSSQMKKFLTEADTLIGQGKIDSVLTLARNSNAPAARVLAAGLERRDEGTERVMKAIENVGVIEMANLESGLVWLATVSNVAPMLGFLGTVIGMIEAFQAIELAGEVEATLVAGGIKVALITTAAGLTIAIPVSIAHNYFISRIDRLVLDMEEAAQKMVDALHSAEARRA